MKTESEIIDMIDQVTPMVHSLVNQYGLRTHPELDDILAEVTLNLLKAATLQWDESKTASWATYAYYTIKSTLMDCWATKRTVSYKHHTNNKRYQPMPMISLDAPRGSGDSTSAYMDSLTYSEPDFGHDNILSEVLSPLELKIAQIVWDDAGSKRLDPAWHDNLNMLLDEYYGSKKKRSRSGNMCFIRRKLKNKVIKYYKKKKLL